MTKSQKRLQKILGRCVATPAGCLEWGGYVDGRGYGKCSHLDGRVSHTHRVVYELYNDITLPSTQVVRHKCDNRKCCEPSHLETGTQQDNVDDMFSRNRATKAAGVSHGSSKLTDTEVIDIRHKYKQGMGISALSRLHNTHTSNIWAIVHNKAWTHLL